MGLISKKMLLRVTPSGLKEFYAELESAIHAGYLEVVREDSASKKFSPPITPSFKNNIKDIIPPNPPLGDGETASLEELKEKIRRKKNKAVTVREELVRQDDKYARLIKFWNDAFVEEFGTRAGNAVPGKDTTLLKKFLSSYSEAEVRAMMKWYIENHKGFWMFKKTGHGNQVKEFPTIGTFWRHRSECDAAVRIEEKKARPQKAKVCPCGKPAVGQNNSGVWVCSRICAVKYHK